MASFNNGCIAQEKDLSKWKLFMLEPSVDATLEVTRRVHPSITQCKNTLTPQILYMALLFAA